MASLLAIGALMLAAVIGTFVLWSVNEPAVSATVGFFEKIRWVAGLIFLALAGYHLVRSENVLYVVIAVGVVAFLTGYLLVEQPWEDTI